MNGEAFLSMAYSFPFSVLQKLRKDRVKLEPLFLGQAGILEQEREVGYYQLLQQEYGFLKQKFNLKARGDLPVTYFRLRPDNFPNLRLAQLAGLFQKQENLFSKVVESKTLPELYALFEVDAL